MNPKKKQKTDKKRQEDSHSLTKTLQKSENRLSRQSRENPNSRLYRKTIIWKN